MMMLDIRSLNLINQQIFSTVPIGFWNERTKLGVAFESSTGFILPNGATRSPDAAWIPQARCGMR